MNITHWRWMECLKNYDFKLKYHPEKANKVTYAPTRKEMHATEVMMLEHDLLEIHWNLNLPFTWS